MTNRFVSLCTGAAVAVALGACEVKTDEEGRMPSIDVSGDTGKLPDYDIVKKEDGRMPTVDVDVDKGKLPDYDVEMADVSVGTKEIETEVPDVDVSMKEKTLTVPDVEVTMPSEKGNDP